MKLRMTLVIVVLVIVFGGIFGYDAFKTHMMKAFFASRGAPVQTISATTAKLEDWAQYIEAVGSLQSFSNVNLTAQQSGQVTKIYFKSGQTVKLGAPLVQQDTAVDEQELNNLTAELTLNQLSYKRQATLAKSGNTSTENVDQARAKYQQSLAEVNKLKTTISQKLIKAPFDGKLGIRMVNLGEYLSPGSNGTASGSSSSSNQIASLASLNPLRLLFSLPGQDYPKVKPGQRIKFSVPAYPNQNFSGTVVAVDSSVNITTRNLQIQAKVPNSDLKLYPGMFADIQLVLPKDSSVIAIPQTAITYSLFGDSVYVLSPDKTPPKKDPYAKKIKKAKNAKPEKHYIANQTFVTLGQKRGAYVAIKDGLKAGDLVITSGQLKIQNKAVVTIDNSSGINKAPVDLNEES
jgi:membrane fusion protein, multidrug efflux system